MNWKRKLKAITESAFDIIPEYKHEEFVNALIKIIFEYCGGVK